MMVLGKYNPVSDDFAYLTVTERRRIREAFAICTRAGIDNCIVGTMDIHFDMQAGTGTVRKDGCRVRTQFTVNKSREDAMSYCW